MPSNWAEILEYKQIMYTKRVIFAKVLVILIINIFVTNILFAQFFTLGENPSRIKWSFLENSNYRLVYPRGSDSLAKRYFNLLESTREMFHSNPSKIDVIIHQYNLLSNGMVGIAPKRVELFSRVPINNDYSHDWHNSLIIHELRHVSQINQFEKGIYSLPYTLFGEQATAIAVGVFLSRWEMEGDAVVAETEFTRSGRGRDPNHLAYYKTAFLNGDFRTWENWTLGSYRRYTPNVYSFGYLYNSYVRTTSLNSDYLYDITKYISHNIFDIRAKNRAYRKYTMNSKRGNYRDMVPYYTKIWEREQKMREPYTNVKYLTNNMPNNYELISSIFTDSTQRIFGVYSNFDKTSTVVEFLDNNRLNEIVPISLISSNIVFRDSLMIWSEIRPSFRWGMENYSDIYTFDLNTNSRERKTDKKSFFNLAKSDSSLFAIDNLIEGKTQVVELDYETYNVIRRYPKYKETNFKEIICNKQSIVALACDGQAFYILLWSRSDNEWKEQIRVEDVFIKQLSYSNESNLIYFIADYQRVDNLYAYDITNKIIRRIFNSKYGINSYAINPLNGNLVISDYSHGGYRIGIVRPEDFCWDIQPINGVVKDKIAENLSLEASRDYYLKHNREFKLDSISENKYRKIGSLFKIHSWAPFYYDIDNIKAMTYESLYDILSPGVVVFSQNLLNTSFATLGYSYRGRSSGHLSYTYTGLYPIFDFKIDYNTRDRYQFKIVEDSRGEAKLLRDTINRSNYLEMKVLSYIPINLSEGGRNRGLIISTQYKMTNDHFFSFKRGSFLRYSNLDFGISHYNVSKMAYRDIFPRVGYGISSRFSFVPNSSRGEFGSVFYLNSYFYIPGLASTHGLKLSLIYQKQFVKEYNYLLSNIITFPLGYSDRFSKEARAVKIEYVMPLITRDISWDNVFYIKRIQLNPFFHFFDNRSYSGSRERLFSYGADLVFNSNIFNISFPVDVGLRAGLNRESKHFFQFIFSTPL